MTASEFFYHAKVFLLALFVTLIPYKGIDLPVMDVKEPDCLLNVEMISDTHIEADYPFRSGFIKQGLKRMSKSKTPVDAIIVDGDLTNYADEPSLAKYYEIIKAYAPAQVITVAGNHDIGHAGDRDKTDLTREECLANVIKYYNDYSGRDLTTNYYSETIKGYKFIVLGDEVLDGGHWDAITMTPEQLEFLDRELAEGTANGNPVFVCCHWALDGVNGENTIWGGDSGITKDEYPIQEILEKYENVFYISGHMHGGVRADVVGEKYDMPIAEQINGVTYISLPTYGIINWYGITWSGLGGQLEVYRDHVNFRPINYLTGNWYPNANYSFDLV